MLSQQSSRAPHQARAAVRGSSGSPPATIQARGKPTNSHTAGTAYASPASTCTQSKPRPCVHANQSCTPQAAHVLWHPNGAASPMDAAALHVPRHKAANCSANSNMPSCAATCHRAQQCMQRTQRVRERTSAPSVRELPIHPPRLHAQHPLHGVCCVSGLGCLTRTHGAAWQQNGCQVNSTVVLDSGACG